MSRKIFYRNVRAREQLEVFLIAAAGSLLVTRFYLHIAGYPEIGSGGLHIGHMLFGGIFMLASITINLSFLGMRIQRLSALLGGIGFGMFIDEMGKFITSDNDYFYRPAVGIIYAVFIILYLTFNFVSRAGKLSSREYQLNAMTQLEEAILHDMDPVEKQRAHDLLARASRGSSITLRLQELLESVDLVPENQPRFVRRFLAQLDSWYVGFWKQRTTRALVRGFFIVEAAIFVLAIGGNLYVNLNDITSIFNGRVTYGVGLLVGQLAASSVAAIFALVGTLYLKESRLQAFEYFRRATLINLFLTEFFVFSRIEFQALPGFLFNLVLLLLITYVMHQERRANRYHHKPHVVQAEQAITP